MKQSKLTPEILALGQELLELRATTKRGEFVRACKARGVEERSAQHYMKAARLYAENSTAANLPLVALYKLPSETQLADDSYEMLATQWEHSEKGLELAVYNKLTKAGVPAERQVPCAYGVIDILTLSKVIEVKLYLTRPALFHAIGQVLLYREAVDPGRRAIIIGYPDPGNTTADLIAAAPGVGVKVVLWPQARSHT